MASFSLDFPDDVVLNVLGDDITVIPVSGGSYNVKGEFAWKFLDDELGDSIGIQHPTIEINSNDVSKFKRKAKVIFDGTKYIVMKVIPSDMQKHLVILRSNYTD